MGWAGDVEFVADDEPRGDEPPRERRRLRWSYIVMVALAALAVSGWALAWEQHPAPHVSGSPLPSRNVGTSQPNSVRLTSHRVRLVAGEIHGSVIVTATTDPAQLQPTGQVTVEAVLHGLPPGARTVLQGGDCVHLRSPVTWASGTADPAGTATLSGRVFQLRTAHDYYLTLGPWRLVRRAIAPDTPPPGVNGDWLNGDVSAFVPGGTPCL